MKVAIVGAFGSGKTTLFNRVRQISLPGSIGFAEEASRQYFEQAPSSLEIRGTVNVQLEIQALAASNELASEQAYKHVLCDGTVFTPAMYMAGRGFVDESKILALSYAQHLKTYGAFVLANCYDITYMRDDIRIEDETVRNHMHEAYLRFLKENGCNYIILSGSTNERLSQLKNFVPEFGL